MQRNAKDQPSADAQGTAEQGEPASRWLIPEAGSPEYWRKVLADPGAHGYTAENAQRLAASFTGPRTERSAEEAAYRLLGWFDKMLSAAHWFGLKNVAPIEAAMLLCQFNPSTNGFDVAERMTNDETNPQNLIELRRRLEDLAQSEPRARSLRDWLGIAKELKLRHHSWINRYLAAVEVVGKGRPGGTRGDAEPVPPADEAHAMAVPEAAAVGTAGASDRVVMHSIKTKSRDILDPVIELAQGKCVDPKDTAQVLAQMQVLAQEEHPPLLAATVDGLKYTKNGTARYLRRDALDKRLHPEKRKPRR